MLKKDNPFAQLGLRPWLTKQLTKLGLKQSTPIQEACIPAILEGKDCIGAAKTGSGKTFAFALPILEKLSEEPTSHFALILTPTHELAYQVCLLYMWNYVCTSNTYNKYQVDMVTRYDKTNHWADSSSHIFLLSISNCGKSGFFRAGPLTLTAEERRPIILPVLIK